jgi:hypothetical protein
MEVGTDRKGKPLYGGYVVLSDAPAVKAEPQKRASPMPDAAKIALDALYDAIVEHGVPPSASLQLPRSSVPKVVTVEQWRQEAYRKGISTGGERAQQQAFARGSTWSIGNKRAVILDGYAWPLPRKAM